MLLLMLAGCPLPDDKADDSAQTTDGGGGDTAESVPRWGLTITGTVVDLETGAASASGLCVTAMDLSPAVSGGEPTSLATGTVGSGGTFLVTGITETPTIGVSLTVSDCDGSTVHPIAVHVAPEDVYGLGEGDELAGVGALSMSVSTRDRLVDGFALAGAAWDPETEGMLLGEVLDATGAPLRGATVVGAADVWYFDGDASDGLFTTDGAPNESTGVSGRFAVPDAPIFTWSAEADGYTFESTLVGGIAGLALFVSFEAR